ncbi:ribonuclease domain-containing protein [Facklamia sp. P12932]|uniref:ribonuclease domain-containing protein n=1 Tax=Facklamia sp. P12932 TaxID=3421947 RepID=UPI003D1733FA
MKTKCNYLLSLLILFLAISLSGCLQVEEFLQEFTEEPVSEQLASDSSKTSREGFTELKIETDPWLNQENTSEVVQEEAFYYNLEQVAAYIHQYNRLPANYITKEEATKQNWSTADPIYVIAGNRFGNREGKLPKKKGRQYYEADIQAGYSHHRGSERIVYSNDGLIYYTDDHYDSFKQLY